MPCAVCAEVLGGPTQLTPLCPPPPLCPSVSASGEALPLPNATFPPPTSSVRRHAMSSSELLCCCCAAYSRCRCRYSATRHTRLSSSHLCPPLFTRCLCVRLSSPISICRLCCARSVSGAFQRRRLLLVVSAAPGSPLPPPVRALIAALTGLCAWPRLPSLSASSPLTAGRDG